jgi:membrane fusion protein, copper/silver efflux system
MKWLQTRNSLSTVKVLSKLKNNMNASSSIPAKILRLIPVIATCVALALLALISCESKKSQEQAHDHAHDRAYTCPMHPQIIQDKPGKCPICGMDLVAVDRSEAQRNVVMLTDNQMKLGNISVEKVSTKIFGQSTIVNGKLTLDLEESKTISSRVAGRIERIAFKETGKEIGKGNYLYSIYSEQLLTLQQEYLLAREQYEKLGATEARYKSFMESAEKKLLLYGMTRDQVRQLKGRESLNPTVTFVSPVAGVITEVKVTEGQYVPEGTPLFRIENLDNLWAEAELYPDETPDMKVGDTLEVYSEENRNFPQLAIVTFLSPELRASSQIITMRAELKNSRKTFRPGQQVNIVITHSRKKAMTLPAEAIVRSEKGTHVYLMNGENTFTPVMVTTGLENEREVEITKGLSEGDMVAVSGAYLIYSEMILKNGKDPMAGHHH